MEALSREFREGVLQDDLVVMVGSMEECKIWLPAWKEGMEKKGLYVSAAKIKVMICGAGLDTLRKGSSPVSCAAL